MSKKKKNQKTRKNSTTKSDDLLLNVIFVLIGISALVLIYLVAMNFDFFGLFQENEDEPILIRGECYAMFDTVFYQIENDNDCKRECSNECWVRDKEYEDSEFIETPTSCNNCNCFCD